MTLESPLDCKEIQPVHSEGDQSWVFFGRTVVEAETPILWPPDVKSWLTGKHSDAGRDWREAGEGDDRGWDGWMASLTRWTWVSVNSRSWWININTLLPIVTHILCQISFIFNLIFIFYFLIHNPIQCVGHSVVSNSLWPCGLYPARLLCPCSFPGKNAGVGSHFLPHGNFPTQG